MEKILHRVDNGDATTEDLDVLLNVASQIEGHTICAFGEAAAWPVRGFILKFRDEFERRCKPSRAFVALNVVHGRRSSAPAFVQIPS